MKKNYNNLQNILSRRGIGFNAHGDYKIECSDEQWEQIVKVDNNAKFMRNKPWPHWYKWEIIFGKVRANGGTSEDMLDASYRQNAHNQPINLGEGEDYHVNMEEVFTNDNTEAYATTDSPDDYSTESGKSKSIRNKSGTKRKTSGSDTALMEFLGNLYAKTNARLEVISARIGYEFDLGKSRQDVFDMLGKVVGITRAERFDLCNILDEKSQRLEIFIGMTADDKPDYVRSLLDLNRR
ncbi:hypothetical protein AAHA92_00352 [Salvia divinorum]|uniref:Myb/SANT-like domain-containing protein n=1 Tax=Salvia divinorum TaxID=28513 RepID=A0ABD1IJA2_SALDI